MLFLLKSTEKALQERLLEKLGGKITVRAVASVPLLFRSATCGKKRMTISAVYYHQHGPDYQQVLPFLLPQGSFSANTQSLFFSRFKFTTE